ncbi:response regulator [Brevibacillus migulae]|uniref:response regulator n=1 Tax=Brevibacillus migulae TaxID=1644114 RepID=UPI00106E392A|nr:response regulator transcription factor [Brevibacillus migulae]
MSIRILLVDDHAVVLRGLHFFLATQKDFTIIGEAHNGKEALDMVAASKPDVVLMDLVMPEMDGIEATAQIRKLYPDVKVLVLTSYNDQDYVLPALQAGASGYLLKDMKPDQIVESIRGALSGNTQLHPDVTQKLMAQMSAPLPTVTPSEGKPAQTAPSVWENITKREREVLILIAQGMSNKEIASVLVIAEKTVKTHVSSILSKLNLADRTQAALFAVKNGMLE